MKKLVAIAMVLGLVSMANAALTLDTTGNVDVIQGNTLTLSIVSDNQTGWVGYAIVEEGGAGALSNIIRINAGVNDISTADPYTEAGWGVGYEITTADSSVGGLQSGIQWTFDWDTSALNIGDTAVISLWDDSVGYNSPVGAVTATVTPEPMTLALLGLGGLLLRRKK